LRAVSRPFDSQAYQEAQDNYQVVVWPGSVARAR
jgi:hypothetical protein